ncbi:MAG: EpsG family protein [Acidobacteriaceae bacterium]
MYWYYFIYGLVLCGVALSLINDEKLRRRIQGLYFPFVLFVLAIFAGLRSPDVDWDYGSYLDWFNSVTAGNLVAQDWAKDPAFVLASYIVSGFGLSYIGVTLFYATTALVAQLYFSKMASHRRWITLFFYLVICSAFIGSEMTQTRAAVAIPLMSISILLAFKGKRKIALLLYVVALTFHLSALIGLPPFVLAMLNVQLRSRWWILSLLPAALFARISLQNVLPVLSQISRVSDYLNGNYSTEGVRLLSVYFVVRVLALALVMIFYWNKLSWENRLAVFCCSFGLFIQIALSSNDALALRGAEVFALFDICVFMIPLDYLKGNFRILYAAGLVFLGLVFFHSTLKIINPYQWIFA